MHMITDLGSEKHPFDQHPWMLNVLCSGRVGEILTLWVQLLTTFHILVSRSYKLIRCHDFISYQTGDISLHGLLSSGQVTFAMFPAIQSADRHDQCVPLGMNFFQCLLACQISVCFWSCHLKGFSTESCHLKKGGASQSHLLWFFKSW